MGLKVGRRESEVLGPGEGERRPNLLRLFLLLPHSRCTVLSALAWMPPQLQGEK